VIAGKRSYNSDQQHSAAPAGRSLSGWQCNNVSGPPNGARRAVRMKKAGTKSLQQNGLSGTHSVRKSYSQDGNETSPRFAMLHPLKVQGLLGLRIFYSQSRVIIA
jgi:hypothetical protein